MVSILKEYELKRMAELYRKGIVSLQEAATQAKLSLYEMMEYVKKENIHPQTKLKKKLSLKLKNLTIMMCNFISSNLPLKKW